MINPGRAEPVVDAEVEGFHRFEPHLDRLAPQRGVVVAKLVAIVRLVALLEQEDPGERSRYVGRLSVCEAYSNSPTHKSCTTPSFAFLHLCISDYFPKIYAIWTWQ